MNDGAAGDPHSPDDDFEEARDFLDGDLEGILAELGVGGGVVPPELWSTGTNLPFDTCVECSRPLRVQGAPPYLIQKSSRNGECVFEFALCTPCMERNEGEMSEASRAAVERFFRESGMRAFGLNCCNLCGVRCDPILGELEHVGLVRGDQLVGTGHAFCGPCVARLESILSEETRRSMDDFVQRNFPGVPDGIHLPLGVF